jgi:SAM-dependent methyltransferase
MLGGLAYAVSERFHDYRLGVRTTGLVMPKEADYKDGTAFPYLGISYKSLAELFRMIKIDPSRDVFVDYGSGLGRVPFFAAQYPFKRVIGLDLSLELHEAALANLDRAQPRLMCKNVEFVHANALDYELPHDVTVIYFYMPFGLDILERVMGRIRQSVRAAPRTVRIYYVNPLGKFSIAGLREKLPWVKMSEKRVFMKYLELVIAEITPETINRATA